MNTIRVEGLDVIHTAVAAAKKAAIAANSRATVAAANVVKRAAKARCPVLTGNLKKSIKCKKLRTNGPKQTVLVGAATQGRGAPVKNDGWYLHLVERGTVRTPPRPFLRPAYDESRAAAQEQYRKTYHEQFNRRLAKQNSHDFQDLIEELID